MQESLSVTCGLIAHRAENNVVQFLWCHDAMKNEAKERKENVTEAKATYQSVICRRETMMLS